MENDEFNIINMEPNSTHDPVSKDRGTRATKAWSSCSIFRERDMEDARLQQDELERRSTVVHNI